METRREMFAGELLANNGGKGNFILSVAMTIKGEVSEYLVRNALRKMQECYPELRAFVEGDELVYPDTSEAIPVRIVERHHEEQWKEELAREWSTPFNASAAPLVRCVWIRSGEYADFIFSTLHLLFDGLSGAFFMKTFIALLDDPDLALPVYRPFGSISELIPDIALDKKEVRAIKRKFFIGKLLINTRMAFKKTVPVKNYFTLLRLDKEKTLALNALCTAKGCSIMTCLMVILARVVRRHRHPAKVRRKMIVTLDIRRYLTTVKKDMLFSFDPSIDVFVDSDRTQEFWTQVKAVKKDIEHQALHTDVKRNIALNEEARHMMGTVLKAFSRADIGHDFMVANLGRITASFSKNKALNLQSVNALVINAPWCNNNTVVLSQHKGEMLLSFVANEVTLAKEVMEQISLEVAEEIDELLMRETARKVEPA